MLCPCVLRGLVIYDVRRLRVVLCPVSCVVCVVRCLSNVGVLLLSVFRCVLRLSFVDPQIMLNILEDYLIASGISYGRIDGSIQGPRRQKVRLFALRRVGILYPL